MPTPKMKIADIRVGRRVRGDLGDLKSLAASIRELGLLQPVVVSTEGRLVAGERRLESCKLLGWSSVPVHIVDLEALLVGEAAENLVRKDFLPSELVALKRALEPLERKLAKQRQGTRTDRGRSAELAGKFGESRDRIARSLGIGRTVLEQAEAVVRAAEQNPRKYGFLIDRMDRRTGSVFSAHRELTIMKLKEKLKAAPPPLPTGPFDVVVADPPWRYESTAVPYPTMALDDIKGLPVNRLASKNAVLWLWTTNAHLPVAFDVVKAWGFEYRTIVTWGKNRIGKGEWLMAQTEHILLASRGKPAFHFRSGASTLLMADIVRGHSIKPDAFYQMVEKLCPGSKVELFARQQRRGWTAHQVDEARVA